MMDDELNQQFTRRLKKLRGHWLHILEAACGCALVALIVSLFLPKIYRATTYVLVSESKIGAASKDTAALQLVTLPTFTPFVDNDALISESLKKFLLDGPPYNLNVDKFRRHDYLDVESRSPRDCWKLTSSSLTHDWRRIWPMLSRRVLSH